MELEGLTPKSQTSYQEQLRNHIRVILLDLYSVFRSDPTRYLSFYRSPRGYGTAREKAKPRIPKRYLKDTAWVSYDHVVRVTNFLEEKGYIDEIVPGYPDLTNPDKSKLSLMRATGKLIKIMREDYKVLLPMVKPTVSEKDDERIETIILKRIKQDGDRKAKLKAYRDNAETRRIRQNLDQLNELLNKTCILLDISDEELQQLHQRIRNERDNTIDEDKKRGLIDFSRKRLRRIFNNGSFEFGGRYYGGWWQNIPREYRQYIRLNGKDVVECDYSGMHVNMLYALERVQPPAGDVYELAQYSGAVRDYLKRLLLILINSESTNEAYRAIMDHRDPDFMELPNEVDSVESIFTAFCDKHKPISHHFCSGIGIWLQNLDSQIAEKVMMAFVDMGHPILPMHDSFIVHHGWESHLQELMNEAFEEVMGIQCEVDLKYSSITERQKRQGGSRVSTDITLDDMLRKSHSIYKGFLSEHRAFEDMEYKRRLQSLRDRGFDPFDDGFVTIDDILNDSDPEEPLAF